MPRKKSNACMPVQELAQRIGKSAETIRAAIDSGEFPIGFSTRAKGNVRKEYWIPREPAEHFLRTGRLPE